MPDFSFLFTQDTIRTLFYISLTLLVAITADNILRSFIKVPKNFENRRSRTYITFLKKTITVIVYVIAVNFIFIQLGINFTPFLASASIIGIVVGIGARALVEDLINGIFLLSQENIAIGDYVKIDDVEGTIEKLGFRSLSIRGDGGELYMIPNGIVKRVVNYSRNKANMFIDFPIRADQEIDPAFKALEDSLDTLLHDKEYKDFIFDGSGVLGITDFKIEGRVVLRVKIRTTQEMRYSAARKYRYLVKKNFEKNKIVLL